MTSETMTEFCFIFTVIDPSRPNIGKGDNLVTNKMILNLKERN